MHTKIFELVAQFSHWFCKYNLKPPRVVLIWDDPREFYSFEAEVRTLSYDNKLHTPPHIMLDALDGLPFEIMGFPVRFQKPTSCRCEVCKLVRHVSNTHGTL